jgi:hypothetical protein
LRREVYLSKCYCTCEELTSIKLVVPTDFAMQVVMTWQILIWEQAEAGNSAGKTRRHLQ